MFRLATAVAIGCACAPIALAEDVDRLASRLPILEEQVREACATERSGEARATLAYLTFNRASALTQELNRELAKLYLFLDSPEELAYRQLEEDLATARERSRQKYRAQLGLDVQQLDWMRMQKDTDRPYSEAQMDRQRQKVKRAKKMFDYFSRNDAVAESIMPPEQMRKLLAIKIDTAMKRMKQMTVLGRRFDQASARAWGCWVTATNSGRLADPNLTTTTRGNGSAL